ncbi:MAG: hypothetical protein M3Z36_08195 [Acidobacteriota bacterium]|nr:hypothetical protein [Acidobacteriota bacterium]
MAKWFCGSGFVSVKAVTRFSGSVRTVIEDTATAATNAASKPVGNSGDAPTAATKGVPKAGSIIAIGSANTAAASVHLDPV